MVAVGALLAVGVLAFYALGLYSSSQLPTLNASFEGPPALPQPDASASLTGAPVAEPAAAPANAGPSATRSRSWQTPHESAIPSGSQVVRVVPREQQDANAPAAQQPTPTLPAQQPLPAQTDLAQTAAQDAPAPVVQQSALAQPGQQPAPAQPGERPTPARLAGVEFYASYPAMQLHPKYWHQPMWAGADAYTPVDTSATDGFIAASELPLAHKGNNSPALRMSIPAIGVDSGVSELALLSAGDTLKYETPNRVVGHIPGTANPGELGNGWYFGHLESLLLGEGNVFYRLPEIAERITNGDHVYVSVTSEQGVYLYQVVESKVMHHTELRLWNSPDATITLVTCANRPHYDHRQVVTAKLVGFHPVRHP